MAPWLLIFSVNIPSKSTDKFCYILDNFGFLQFLPLFISVSPDFRKKVCCLYHFVKAFSSLWCCILLYGVAVDAMKLPFLNAYHDSIGRPSFQKGCNHAAAGTTIHPATPTSICPFSFDFQVNQFLHFKLGLLNY